MCGNQIKYAYKRRELKIMSFGQRGMVIVVDDHDHDHDDDDDDDYDDDNCIVVAVVVVLDHHCQCRW